MSRRVLQCRLDAGCERPEHRTFDFDPVEETRRGRAALLVDGLTVLRAYAVAGRPAPLNPLGSFSEWNWVREAIVWLGYHDPIATQADVRNNDEEATDLGEFMSLWRDDFGNESWTVGQAFTGANEELTQLMVNRCGNAFSSKKFGRWLGRNQDRIVDGLQLCCRDNGHRQWAWYVADVSQDEGEW